MAKNNTQMLEYYAQPEAMTDGRQFQAALRELPSDIPSLCHIIQEMGVHIFWAERYGLTLNAERRAEVSVRHISYKLERAQELDPAPFAAERPLDRKVVNNCRDIAVLLCAFLRAHGIPARARCGFATYFTPLKYEDHWVCEYWSETEQRWVMVDAQLDAFQRKTLGIGFNPLDMPPGAFVLAGEAWQMCRRGDVSPDRFGIFQFHGMGFVRGNVARDLLSLNKLEVLPWDEWGWVKKPITREWETQRALFDRVAELTTAVDQNFDEVLSTYQNTPALQIPDTWLKPHSYRLMVL